VGSSALEPEHYSQKAEDVAALIEHGKHAKGESNSSQDGPPPHGNEHARARAEGWNLMDTPVSLPNGDLFSIGFLLRAASVDLDSRRNGKQPSYVGGSFRSSGVVLVIRISYSNFENWLGVKVLPWKRSGPGLHYTVRVTRHSSHEDYILQKVQNIHQRDNSENRTLSEYHGIRILVEQNGSMAVWDNIQLFLILTTGLAMLAVSNCITDTAALYLMPRSDQYWEIKFDRPRRKGKPNSPRSQHSEDEQDDPRDRLRSYDSTQSLTV